MNLRHKSLRPGVSLIELIALLGILGFLFAMIVPIVQIMRERARQTESINNLRQLGIAAHNFHDVHKAFPPAVGSHVPRSNSHGTAHFYLLPYVEQHVIYQKAKNNVSNNKTYSKRIKVFLSPQDHTAPPGNLYDGWLATCNYPANWLVFGNGNQRITNIPDGTSNTLMFAERYQLCNGKPHAWGYAHLYYWAPVFGYYSQGKFQNRPSNAECDPRLAQSINASGISVAMCDGSVQTVAPTVSPKSWANASDPRDGNPLENDF